jgi:hypothetical protein
MLSIKQLRFCDDLKDNDDQLLTSYSAATLAALPVTVVSILRLLSPSISASFWAARKNAALVAPYRAFFF